MRISQTVPKREFFRSSLKTVQWHVRWTQLIWQTVPHSRTVDQETPVAVAHLEIGLAANKKEKSASRSPMTDAAKPVLRMVWRAARRAVQELDWERSSRDVPPIAGTRTHRPMHWRPRWSSTRPCIEGRENPAWWRCWTGCRRLQSTHDGVWRLSARAHRPENNCSKSTQHFLIWKQFCGHWIGYMV